MIGSTLPQGVGSALSTLQDQNGKVTLNEAQARKSAEEFESVFLSSLLQPVFKSLSENAAFGGGFAEETWSDLLTQEYANEISASSELGISDAVYKELIALQEESNI